MISATDNYLPKLRLVDRAEALQPTIENYTQDRDIYQITSVADGKLYAF
jgi:hypothetical protein